MKNKNITFKHLLIFWAFFSMASLYAQRIEKKVNTVKTYTLTDPEHTLLKINTRFSEIRFIPSDKPEIVLVSDLRVKGDEKKVNRFINNFFIDDKIHNHLIDIAFDFNYEEINLFQKLEFEHKIEIRYPENISLEIEGDYLKIHLNQLKGNLRLDTDYAKLYLGYLRGKDNNIEGDYIRANIKFIHNADIDSDFSVFNIDMNFKLDIQGDHSKYTVKRAKNIRVDGDFVRLNSGRTYYINFNSDHSQYQLRKTCKIVGSGDYNEFTISDLPEKFRLININGDFQSIKIINNRAVPYRFEIKMDFGDLEYNDLQFETRIIDNDEKYFKGYYLNPDTDKIMYFNLGYGELSFENKTAKKQ